jgi:hypothetical protein
MSFIIFMMCLKYINNSSLVNQQTIQKNERKKGQLLK